MVDVSICITTYNVENYLRECLDSIFLQATQYSFDIVVCDDCSTDNTRAILEEYDAKYPGVFKLYYNKENLRYAKNYNQAFSLCTGKYIAILDGDDYWTSSDKLQKQISFLEANPDFAMSHHEGSILKNGTYSPFTNKIPGEVYTTKELLGTANIWNSSVVYRNVLNGKLPNWFLVDEAPYNQLHIDYPLHVIHSRFGKIKFFPEDMGVYRIHDRNISANQERYNYFVVNLFVVANLKNEVSSEFHPQLNLISARHYAGLSGYHRKNGHYGKALGTFCKSILKKPLRSIFEYKEMYYHVFKN